MWCLRARRLMSAFFDRELDHRTDSALSSHLRWCWWCRKEAGKVERGALLARRARDVRIPLPSPTMLAAIQSTERIPGLATAKSSPWPLALVAAAIVILAITTLNNPLRQYFWPFGKNSTVYALDFGVTAPDADKNPLQRFLARYEGKFREIAFEEKLDPAWVPFAFKFPTQLPPGMRLKSVMVFNPEYCGSIGLTFTDGSRNLYLLQQPEDRPIALTGLKTTTDEFCKNKTRQCAIGSYTVMTWTSDNLRTVVLSNLKRHSIETALSSLEIVQ